MPEMSIVRSGRYISVDGNWIITRVTREGNGRFRPVTIKQWVVGLWNEAARDFLPVDGATFESLQAARAYVDQHILVPLFGEL